MNKGIIIAAAVLAVILAVGIFECLYLKNNYTSLADEISICIEKAKAETLATRDCDDLEKHWIDLRETTELFLPHADIYELNLRIYEGISNAKSGDMKETAVHLSIAKMLAEYIPQLVRPLFSHII